MKLKTIFFDTWKKNYDFKTGIFSTKFSLRCTLSLILGFLRSKTEIENSIIKICSKSARNVSSLLCHRAKILYSISGKSTHVQLGKKNQENRRKNILEVTDWGHWCFLKVRKSQKQFFLPSILQKKHTKKLPNSTLRVK